MTVRLSQWMEDDERCIYLFVKKLEQILKTDTKKEPTETEITILTEYRNNYLELRLTNKFILDVSAPLIKFLNFFESTEVRVHLRFATILDLVYNFLSKFLHNAGLKADEVKVTGKRLMKIDYKLKRLQLSDQQIFWDVESTIS